MSGPSKADLQQQLIGLAKLTLNRHHLSSRKIGMQIIIPSSAASRACSGLLLLCHMTHSDLPWCVQKAAPQPAPKSQGLLPASVTGLIISQPVKVS